MTELYCYVMMRTDLSSLGHGKALAHAHHAGSHLTWNLVVEPMLRNEEVHADVLEWHRAAGGFGACLAVGGTDQITLPVLQGVTAAAETLGHRAGLVVDPTYPHIVDPEVFALMDRNLFTMEPRRTRGGYATFRRETTCGWILGEKERLEVILRRFDLVPNDK